MCFPHLHSQHHQLPKDAAKGQTSDEIEIPHVATAVSGHVSGVVGRPLQAYGKVRKCLRLLVKSFKIKCKVSWYRDG